MAARASVAESRDVSESKSAADGLGRLFGAVPKCLPILRGSTKFDFSPGGFALFAAGAAFFVYLSYRPLWHTDLWGHLAYGRLIVRSGSIPLTEPLIPLCEGLPFVDFSWLSELLAYLTYQWRGAPAVQFLHAASITACVGLLASCCLRKTGSAWAAALAAVIYVWVDWQQLAIVRPQLAGCVCFVVLLASCLPEGIPMRRPRRKLGFGVALAACPPVCIGAARKNFTGGQAAGATQHSGVVALVTTALFVVWANLHGSFLIGLAMLAAFVCGRAGDLIRRTCSVRLLRDDLRLRQGIFLLILASAAVMLNPYGWRIYESAWHLSSNANLADLVEWQPLRLWMWQGCAALAVALGLLVLYVLTPRRISTTELLLLVGLGAATLVASRMLIWWGPVAAYYASLHAAAIWKRWRRHNREPASASARTIPWYCTFVVAGVALACTPLAAALPHRSPSDLSGSLSAETPIGVTGFLCTHPPGGQIFNTLEWGDYLLWAGPARLQVFVASHVHLVPRSVWQDYVRIITLDDGWQKILERYRINTAIVDDDRHAALADALREDPAWAVLYEDAQGLAFVRRQPL
jgi:hypothetical protein